jgi:hypothetical protein
VVIDPGGVEAGDGDTGEEMAEESGPRPGQLVQDERGAGDLREDGEKASAGRGLQDAVGRRDRGRGGRHECQPERSGELLEGLAVLGAPRVGREQARHLRQHR